MAAPVDLTADPIKVGLDIGGWVTTDPSVRFTSVHGVAPVAPRATAVMTLQALEPVIHLGKPEMPRFRVANPSTMTLKQGAGHARAVPNPAPVWDPQQGKWVVPPGLGGVGTYRWTVATLPLLDDYVAGKYDLGSRSGLDETTAIPDNQTGWYPDDGSEVKNGPIWHAEYPFKPTVAVRKSVVAGKTIVHPIGVHFSSGNLSHMWLDMGASKPQPFTWIIVAILTRRFVKPLPIRQVILEAGRNPYQVGVPQKTPAQLGDNIVVNDGLAYHTALASSGDNIQMSTLPTSGSLIAGGMSGVRPMMFATVFNGASSVLFVKDNLHQARVTGTVQNGAPYQHRYYVLGRNQGQLNDLFGQEMVVFEMRFWTRVLTTAEIDSQYSELSSTYLFSKYTK